MTKKPESSKGKKQEKPADKSRQENVQDTADFDQTTDSLLAAGGSDPDKLASLLDKSDAATQERLIGRLQQTRGNLFVQRMLAQRQSAEEHADAHSAESSEAGSINESQYTPEEWSSFGSAANSGAQTGINIFQSMARLSGVIINGPIALGGRLRGPSIGPLVMAQVMGAGAPPEVAAAFGNAANTAWRGWVNMVSIPGLPMYPSFAAVPGPMAPPTPNIPMPLSSIAPGASIDAGDVLGDILSSLGELANEEGAHGAAMSFAIVLSVTFGIWFGSKQVINVLGRGPVPSFAPPYVTVGPVIMGDTLSIPGIII